jgi:GNAT superfamily N-acetyltransferase
MLRAATIDDQDALVDLATRRCPALEPAAFADLFDPAIMDLYGAFVATEGDELIGWSCLAHRRGMPDGWRGVRVFVDREHEDKGVGRALRSAAMECLDPAATEIRCGVFDDDERSLSIAKSWDLEVLQHSITSRLDLEAADPPEPPAGVTLEACGDLEFDDADAVQACLTASQTNPEAAEGLHIDLAMLVGFNGSHEIPIGSLARLDGVPVALTHGGVADSLLHLSWTGVDPAYRGHGLAKLVKQHAHVQARAVGAAAVLTDNEEHNAGIRHVNDSLGYRRSHGTYWMRQRLGTRG